MVTRLNPYLNFDGNAREALTFYHAALGGTLEMTSFKDGGMGDDPAIADLIMHGAVVSETGLALFAADTPPGMDSPVTGTSVTVSFTSDDTDLRPYWDKLSEGGRIDMPFEVAPWGDRFGAFSDRFGIPWMFDQPADA